MTPLRVLLVEDQDDDTRLLVESLQEGGFAVDVRQVTTEAELHDALATASWDLLLVSDDLAQFNGLAAVRIAHEVTPDLPVIMVSGQTQEARIVAAMRAGADDYLVKDRLGRLVPAVEHELQDRQVRRERKQAEEAQEQLLRLVEEQRARLLATLEALPVGVWIADADGKMVLVNQAAAEIYGGRAPVVDQVAAYTVYQIWWPDTQEPVAVKDYPLVRALRGEVVRDMVLDHERFDGSRGTHQASANPIRDTAGNILGAVVIALDITERKQAEEALRASETTMNAFFANSPGILNIIDDHFRYLKADPITPTYFGLDSQSIIGILLEDLAPAFVAEFGPMLRQVLHTGEPVLNREVYNPVPGKPDEFTYWRASYFRVPLPEGGYGVGVMGVEITDMKRAEEALLESEARFSAAVDNFPSVYVIYDADRRIRYINKAGLQVSGRPLEDFLGKRDEEVWPSEVTRHYLPHLLHAYATGQTQWFEMTLALPSGIATRRLSPMCRCVAPTDR
jgi:PAS domain S-box-containing protein